VYRMVSLLRWCGGRQSQMLLCFIPQHGYRSGGEAVCGLGGASGVAARRLLARRHGLAQRRCQLLPWRAERVGMESVELWCLGWCGELKFWSFRSAQPLPSHTTPRLGSNRLPAYAECKYPRLGSLQAGNAGACRSWRSAHVQWYCHHSDTHKQS
jgi:hypothetical protein